MTCIDPPELTDFQLALYLDDDADEEIHRHLVRCAHCRERAEELAQEQNSLRVALYRADCPDTDMLRDYMFGMLSGHETGRVELHLDICPHCTHYLGSLREFVADMAEDTVPDTSEYSAIQRIRWVVAELMSGGAQLAPSFVGVRGGGDDSFASYVADDIRVDTTVRVDAQMPEQRVLVGSVMGPAVDVEGQDESWSADLWLGNEWLATEALDDLGSFRFAGLQPGEYEVIVNGPDVKVRVAIVAVA